MLAYAQRRELFVRDCWAGADPAHRIGVRVLTETAWHNLFARNMFLRPRREELEGFKPDFTILNLPGFQADPKLDGTASDCAILVNFSERVVAICGTWYAGEIKKSVFTILNYLLPDKNVLPMHASANIGPKGDVAIFFGLSGTGKTTLSADPSRTLLGDDEHGWGETSLFNFEGGCYAKVIKLQPRGRARDLRHHRALRHGAGERGDRSGDRRARSRRRPATPRTRAPAIRWSSFPTPRRPASPARPRTSSC